MALDLTTDYAILDGLEAVTFRRVDAGATVASVAIASALRRAGVKNAAFLSAAGLALEPTDLTFHLPVALLGAERPKPGDLIEDAAGVVYTILAATRATLATRYACICRERRA